jgi:hypothetical protein
MPASESVDGSGTIVANVDIRTCSNTEKPPDAVIVVEMIDSVPRPAAPIPPHVPSTTIGITISASGIKTHISPVVIISLITEDYVNIHVFTNV